jgi:hypothetical protein
MNQQVDPTDPELTTPNYGAWQRSDWGKLREEVEVGFEKFWAKDQICGFDERGQRVGTGIPRVRPDSHGNFTFGGKKIPPYFHE